MKSVYRFCSIVFVFFCASCSTSRITSSWKASNVQPLTYKKILVLGLINEPDRSIRENMESMLVANLQDLGYTATCSCDEFGPKAFDRLKEAEALAKLSNSGIDAVLTVVLLDKIKERNYVPERIHYSPYAMYQGRFWGYYTIMYGRVYAPGYYVTNTRYFWESNFYSMDDTGTQLLYSAQSQSFDPSSTAGMVYEYGKMITKDLVKAHIITDRIIRN